MTITMPHRRLAPWMLASALLVGGCTHGGSTPSDGAGAQTHHDAPTRQPADVEVRRGEVTLVAEDGTRRQLAVLDPDEQGEVVHASLRPGRHESTTVLLLTKAQDRYTLRYVVAGRGGAGEVYGFPWRLQVSEEVTAIEDVAPTPVWAPDGDAVAWLEWDANGTRLRTVGWIDHGPRSNPSDDAETFRVRDVPAGTQLRGWDVDGPRPTLHGHDGERPWRIELDLGGGAVALPT